MNGGKIIHKSVHSLIKALKEWRRLALLLAVRCSLPGLVLLLTHRLLNMNINTVL